MIDMLHIPCTAERVHAVELPKPRVRRRHRYSINVRLDGEGTFECLIVDHGGDSGGFQEAAWTSFGQALTTALRTACDRQHVAFGAPIFMEGAT